MSEAIARFKALKLFKDFHGYEAKDADIVRLEMRIPETALLIGIAYGIMYKVPETKEPYLHKFTKGKQPHLFVSADGRQAFLVGGSYRFTDRGFIG